MLNQPSSEENPPVESASAEHSRPYLFRGQEAQDCWALVLDPETTEVALDKPAIVPLATWLESASDSKTAPWLPADTELTPELAERLSDAPLIAIDFPKFTDGRGYSVARLLRERYAYQGEVRAIGDVLVDQLFFMTRCGFDGLSLRKDQWMEDALRNLHIFSRAYQPATDQPEPLFRLRQKASNKTLSYA